ncbi:hypothetical protein [Neobacillus citreus]|uniref:Uncharacterized protein n=1 Tax=Neobacillus citreus TaxID=2833578 RepID=A0A942YD40_9BACI|nr:hypothetical protein [Neobacillus citreus]MCH6265318.1 hypothetical protein [Neobacillus citreus]
MNELQVFGELHKFLNGLDEMNCTLAPKSLNVTWKSKGGTCNHPAFVVQQECLD